MSSSAQPVTAMAPVTPFVRLSGVSKAPNAGPVLPGAYTCTFTANVCGELEAPDPVTVSVASGAAPLAGNPAFTTCTTSVLVPLPEGVTDTNGWSLTAVQAPENVSATV